MLAAVSRLRDRVASQRNVTIYAAFFLTSGAIHALLASRRDG